MKKIWILLTILSFTLCAQVHEEFGKNNSFYKVVEVTNNLDVQDLIRGHIENTKDIFLGISYDEEQPLCEGRDKFSLNFLGQDDKCSQTFYIGECGTGSQNISTEEMICE